MKKILLVLFSVFSFAAMAQNVNPWQVISESQVQNLPKVNRSSTPRVYQLFSLDLVSFRNQLAGAPVRGSFQGRSQQEILLPDANGKISRYKVMETPIMEEELAARYPSIKSYAAQGVEDPTAVARFSVTKFGLHSMTFSSGNSTVFIDPYTEDRLHYIVYQKSDLINGEVNFECLTDDALNLPSAALDRNAFDADIFNTDDNTLRTYRLAQSCTAEYGNIFAGTGTLAQQKENIQTQMAITMTRVNGVYEIDLGITMIFVNNNDAIIYLGATDSDPWSNEWNTMTAQTLDSVIGVNNYDIGHNFNTTGGGNAGCLACVCKAVNQSSTHKGRGYTGRSNPTGDAFDIDYVAHEMGHQFGGYHTQSNSSCRSGSGLTEVEPGSASTIMGYAGICAANVQSNSDAYFAYVNIRDIMAYVKTSTGSCSVNTPFDNQAPLVEAGPDYTVPKSTAFVLTAVGSDPDGDVLTYTWEQNDPQSPASNTSPTPTRTVGPMFRSITGTTSPSRYFPAMGTILTGATSNTWEAVPSGARDLNFSVIARDNIAGAGQTKSDLMKVTVNGTAGPFVVNSPNTNVSWSAGSNQTVTWNVAGTTSNGVDCPFVDIFLSTDGGATFPILLASKVPNDGSELVSMPSTTGSQNRIMVKGNNHIFLDVSNNNFTITTTTPTFALTFDGQPDGQNKTLCQGLEATYDILYSTFGGFSGTTTFAVTGNPAGTTATVSPTSLSSNGTVQLLLTDTNLVPTGVYQMVVTGTSGGTTKSVNIYVDVKSFEPITAVNPLDMATGVNTVGNMVWNADTSASSYDYELASDVTFTTIIASGTVNTNQFSYSGLANYTNYFWRVLPKNESCSGLLSDVFSFTTGSGVIICDPIVNSTDVPIAISASGTPTVESTLNIPTGQNIAKITVSLNISHTYLSDLTVTLISPLGTQVQLFSGQCTTRDNAVATFDDDGSVLTCLTTTPTLNGTFIPLESLATLIGENTAGDWILRVVDGFNVDGGSINSWGITICALENTPIACGDITSVWNGINWSNGEPNSNKKAIFDANYNTNNNGNLTACECQINANAAITITNGNYIQSTGKVINNGNLIVEHNGSLVQLDDYVINTGSIEVQRTTSIRRLDYVYWSSPVSSFPVLTISPETPASNVFKWLPTIAENFGNWTIANEDMKEGKGYIVRGPSTFTTTIQPFNASFVGVPNNGIITPEIQRGNYTGPDYPSPTNPLVTVTANDDNFNLIGNPYPSAISALDFLTENTNIEGSVRIWTHAALPDTIYNNPFYNNFVYNYNPSDYIVYNGTGTVSGPSGFNGFIASAQGFFVLMEDGPAATETVTFRNSMRNIAHANNQFFRQVNQVQAQEEFKIWLDFIPQNGNPVRTLVGYVEGATNEKDRLFDASTKVDDSNKLYSLINSDKYIIQGRGLPFDKNDIVPLGYNTTTAGEFMVAIADLVGLGDKRIYLDDKLLNIIHDLTTTPYVFFSTIGIFDDRFALVYQNSPLSLLDLEYANSVLVATGYNQLKIRSLVESFQKITVYDVLGRKLYDNQNFDEREYTVPGISPLNQTLLVKIVMNNGQVVTRKVHF
jgi:subtilisin-like proprotein convertase family protein